MFRRFGVFIEKSGGVEIAGDEVGVFELVAVFADLDGVNQKGDAVSLEEAGDELIFEANHAFGAAWVEMVKSVGSVVFWRGFAAIKDGGIDEGGGLDKIIFGIPIFKTVGDSGENVAPFGKPAASFF